MIVYHGSKEKIEEFDLKKQISGFYPGFYTTIDLDIAKEFGNFIHKIELTGPYFLMTLEKAEELQKQVGSSGSGYLVVQLLKEQGFFGFQRGSEYITFDVSTIKIISIETYG